MKATAQSLCHRHGGEAVLSKFIDFFYHFIESLTEQTLVRENHAVDLRHDRRHKYGLLKS